MNTQGPSATLLPAWFSSLEPPNKLSVPRWIGFHCDRKIGCLTSSLLRLQLHNQLPQHGAQLPSLMGGCSWPQSPPVTSTTVASHCSKSPGGQTNYKKDTTCQVPFSDAWCQPGHWHSTGECLSWPAHPQPGSTSKLGKDHSPKAGPRPSAPSLMVFLIGFGTRLCLHVSVLFFVPLYYQLLKEGP